MSLHVAPEGWGERARIFTSLASTTQHELDRTIASAPSVETFPGPEPTTPP